MDRGVKIAIFVASIAALCLGLIWDQVLSHARVVVEEHSDDVLSAEVIDANIGSPDIERAQPTEDALPFEIKEVDEGAQEPEALPPAPTAWTEYTVQSGDSYWKLANVTFKDRGLTSEDVKRCNNGKELRPGDKFMIPPGKDAIAGGAPARERPPADTGSTPPAGATEYVVKDGDSWWKIAYVHFKDRGRSSDDLIKANPGVKLVAGTKVKIP